MISRLAERIDKRGWRERIRAHRRGYAASSCSGLGFYEDDQCLIRYRKVGRGPAVVFLCDGPATLELYDALIDSLKSDFTVTAFEAPGAGFSVAKGAYSFAFRDANDVIARFLEKTVGHGATLAFSCGGAYAAIDIAHRYPALCSSLVVIQAPSWEQELKWKRRRDSTGLIGTPFLGQWMFPRMMKKRAPDWYKLSMAQGPAVSHFCQCTDIAFDAGAKFPLPTLFQRYLTGDAVPFGNPEQPTLAIWGEQDDSHADTDKTSSLCLARNVELVQLQHVGHFPELEDPGLFVKLLKAHRQP